VLAGIGASIVLIGVALALDRVAAEPLVPPSVSASKATRSAVAAALAAIAGSAGLMYALTIYLQEILGYEPLPAGRLFAAFAAGGLAAASVAACLQRPAPATVLTAGLLLQAAGAAVLARLGDPAPAALFAAIAAVGAGNVLATVAFTVIAVADVPELDHGAAGGVIGTAQQLGATFGLALAGSIVAAAAALRAGVDVAMLVCAVLPLAGAVAVAAMRTKDVA
jgi:predicted MFS family arabinose efflux permease